MAAGRSRLLCFLLLLFVLFEVALSKNHDPDLYIPQDSRRIRKMTGALRDRGNYKNILSIFENEDLLDSVLPLWCTIGHKRLTIFAPSDGDHIGFKYISLEGLRKQVVLAKVDDRSQLVEGSRLRTCACPGEELEVTDAAFGHESIGGVRIRDWNIYSDDMVVVHGVDEFFMGINPIEMVLDY